MFITRIDLENIKSHVESSYEFRRGTTAIIGENGAGKTTLIEAIAWTMFDLLEYTKDAFVRRGAKRGTARVSFESVADERTYIVHRDTGTGYYVYDPSIKTRIADKKDEVQRFLRQHMGVEVGTDLETLFRSAIGVPQGTFTSIFLETPTARKRVFDRLLKVDEYRQSSDRLIETVNYVKNLQIENENAISYSLGQLENYDEVRKVFKSLKAEEKELTNSIRKTEAEAGKLREAVGRSEAVEAEVAELKKESDRISKSLGELKIESAARESEVRASAEAAEKVKSVKKENAEHVKALGMLKELERERGEREKLERSLNEIEKALSKVNSELEKNKAQREQVAKARTKIEELKPKAEVQSRLEKERDSLRDAIAKARADAERKKIVEKEIDRLRERYKIVAKDLKAAEEAATQARSLPELIESDDRLRTRIADLRGKLENDRKFQTEIRNGLCPVLSEKCLNLKEGETLEGFLSGQFEEIEGKIAEAESKRKELSVQLTSARKAQNSAAGVEVLKESAEEIAGRGKKLKEENEILERSTFEARELSTRLEATEKDLGELGNPSGAIRILEEEMKQETPLRDARRTIESNQERLESERREKTEQLEIYKDLSANWKRFSELRDDTLEARNTFLANEEQAGLLAERKSSLAKLGEEIAKKENEAGELQEKIDEISKGFDREAFKRDKEELARLDQQIAVSTSSLKSVSGQKAKEEVKLEQLEKIREGLKSQEAEKKRLARLASATAFIRKTLKEAAPRVARNYVHHVSIEANQLFRDITGIAENTLKWENDYGIALESGGYDRPFQNLSGGEQMAAALSVRLALLRQLSDIKLAFFDEPTANLDLERRERLAEQISRITETRSFDQLFVISHDDTFEGYVDNVILVEPEELEQG